MPNNPPSLAAFTRALISRKTLADKVFWSFAKTRTTPLFSTTNQRVESPGACFNATGWVNDKFGKTSSVVMLGVFATGGGVITKSGGPSPPLPPQALNRKVQNPRKLIRLPMLNVSRQSQPRAYTCRQQLSRCLQLPTIVDQLLENRHKSRTRRYDRHILQTCRKNQEVSTYRLKTSISSTR